MNLRYFETTEFGRWWPKMDANLLVRLDVLRYRLQRPILISPHPDALGRHLGYESQSCHNIDYWGLVLAVDFFVGGIHTREDALEVIGEAKDLGFTGIGVYPEWRNHKGERQVGFHLDVRPFRDMGDPATWGYVGGAFVSLDEAILKVSAF